MAEAPTPPSLWDLLLRANDAELATLCSARGAEIVEAFAGWQQVPKALHGDRAAIQRYAQALMRVAQAMAALGEKSLLARLSGGPDNPVQKWQHGLQHARAHLDAGRYEEARDELIGLRDAAKRFLAVGDGLLPPTLEYLGEAEFQLGQPAAARLSMEAALAGFEKAADASGIQATHAALFEICRYLGQSAAAAQHAHRLGELHRGSPAGARWEVRAGIVERGEPLCRIVIEQEGQFREIDQARVSEGKIRFVFERNRIALRRCNQLTAEGERLCGKGRLEEGLDHLRAAASLDPWDPASRYQAAFTLLELGRAADALELYQAVERLAPGWFQCRADGWLAEQIATGRVKQQVVEVLHRLEDPDLAPFAVADQAVAAIGRFGELPMLRLAHGSALARDGRKDAAIVSLRKGLGGDPEPDVKTRLLFELGRVQSGPERTECWLEARTLAGNLVAAAMAAVGLKTEAN